MTNMKIRERKVRRLIQQTTDLIVGGYENAVLDDHMAQMPAVDLMEAEIYREVIGSDRIETSGGYMPIKEDIRFLTTVRIKELIAEYVAEAL